MIQQRCSMVIRGVTKLVGPSVRFQAAPNESDHRAPLAEDGPTRGARVGHEKAPAVTGGIQCSSPRLRGMWASSQVAMDHPRVCGESRSLAGLHEYSNKAGSGQELTSGRLRRGGIAIASLAGWILAGEWVVGMEGADLAVAGPAAQSLDSGLVLVGRGDNCLD